MQTGLFYQSTYQYMLKNLPLKLSTLWKWIFWSDSLKGKIKNKKIFSLCALRSSAVPKKIKIMEHKKIYPSNYHKYRPVRVSKVIPNQKLPPAHFLLDPFVESSKEKKLWENEDFIGLINCENLFNFQLNGPITLRIGAEEEVSSLRNLRAYCLDRIFVMIRQWGREIDIHQLVLSKQRLVFVCHSIQVLQSFIKEWQNELVLTLGQYCLSQSLPKLFYQLIFQQNVYYLKFLDPKLFWSEIMNVLLKVIRSPIDESIFQILLQKLTLNDYLIIINQQNNAESKRKILHYITQINRQKAQLKIQNNKNHFKTQNSEQIAIISYEEKNQRKYSSEKDRKGSDNSLEVDYFIKKNKDKIEFKNQQNDEEQVIQIYNLNESEEQQSIDQKQRQKRSQKKSKSRSRSADITYLSQNCVDDELFDKY